MFELSTASASVLALAISAFMVARPLRRDEQPLDGRAPAPSGRVDLANYESVGRAVSHVLRKPGHVRATKRAFDIVASTTLLLFLSPLLFLTAIAVKCDSRGPVLYRQRRVGLGGREFEIIKFRSMRMDAETSGPQWASQDDDRITRVGRFIRKVRIDEIPQAVNILRGEMSFVGPRPERPEFVASLECEIPHYRERHFVKPGLTGWAQVKFTYGASVEDAREKLKYDLFYVKNYSLWFDLFICLLTVRVALFGLGSR